MNDLQVRAVVAAIPFASPALQHAMDWAMNPYPGIAPDVPLPALVAEARAMLPALELTAAPLGNAPIEKSSSCNGSSWGLVRLAASV